MTIRLSILDQAPVPEGTPQSGALANSLDLARRAEQFGYTRYWVAEHHAMFSHAISAPEILVAALASATSTLRVGSGGVLLTHYSPFKVAETFRTLTALYPGRIDLGIGRSTGAGELEIRALQPIPGIVGRPSIDEKVEELRDHLARRPASTGVQTEPLAVPLDAGTPELWLLGSSPSSAIAAGEADIDYAFAHFINPAATRAAIGAYHRLAPGRSPIVAVTAVAADTEEEAARLYSAQRAVRNRLFRNDVRPIPEPRVALEELARHGDILEDERFEWPRYFWGTPDRVGDQIRSLATALEVEEIVIVTTVHDHQARVHSYELLAAEFALPATAPALQDVTP
ncbi:MsnO8 family LLM class oxidoreductase [Nocardia concava]|uniref:MsnO8 family LLM class oxidoreductase n=1 Tax=Nocardia concava TaxID=257281 RepID=UPI000314D946|nr:MsnO8 family LLM class oxidoreductase [Nocardia concava]